MELVGRTWWLQEFTALTDSRWIPSTKPMQGQGAHEGMGKAFRTQNQESHAGRPRHRGPMGAGAHRDRRQGEGRPAG